MKQPTNVIVVKFPKTPTRTQRPTSARDALAQAILQNRKQNRALAQFMLNTVFK